MSVGSARPAPEPASFDASLRASRKKRWLVGVDEAGRGPWAGPLMVCAVRLNGVAAPKLGGIRDSKLLSPHRREVLFEVIRAQAAAVAVAWAQPREIDSGDILAETLKAMLRAAVRAAGGIPAADCLVVVDGNRRIPGLELEQLVVVDGDRLSQVVGAASIVAKVMRDRWMLSLDRRYPGYGLARHKGYGTRVHREALKSLGPSPTHRRTYEPVCQLSLW